MFYDQAKILVKSGKGGDGMIGFRREKFVPHGGPDGGDGGRGGDVVIHVNQHLNSLVSFHRKTHFRALDGKHGGRKNQTGATGESIHLEVPPGTIIKDATTGELLADLVHQDQEVVILHGGRGGRGNARFASSRNQAPRLAERGEPGEELWVILELKLIADIGIIGLPNAGKSTLLSVISAAKPKIADYPFTTLQPNLGVVQIDEFETIVIADIPGLIEGASAGAGLGHDFLRHVERTRMLIHLLDGSDKEPLENWALINQELALYDLKLEEKPQLVVLNKMDLPDSIAWEPLIEERILEAGYSFCSISAATGSGVQTMLYEAKRIMDTLPSEVAEPDSLIIIRPEPDESSFKIERENDGWRIHGKSIERIAAMTYWEFEATTRRFQQILEKTGISKALVEAGVNDGDTVYIGDETLEWSE